MHLTTETDGTKVSSVSPSKGDQGSLNKSGGLTNPKVTPKPNKTPICSITLQKDNEQMGTNC